MMRRLKRSYVAIRRVANVVAGLSILGMMVTIVVDVIARDIGRPIYWTTDISLVLIVFLAFLAMGFTQAERGHVRVEMLLTRVSPRARNVLEMISWILSLLFCVVLLIAGTAKAIDSVRIMEGTLGIIHFPIWPARIVLVIGIFILCIQLAIDIFNSAKKIWSTEEKPCVSE